MYFANSNFTLCSVIAHMTTQIQMHLIVPVVVLFIQSFWSCFYAG